MLQKKIVEEEALLGVSMTGMMDMPNISFNKNILQNGAKVVNKWNKIVAKLININPAARTTCIKPAGTTSCIFGTASGIHPRHSKRYFRRVQANKEENTLKFFAEKNSIAVEESVWSSNKTDDVITFLCKSSPDALTKKDIGAVELLKRVKLVQENWVVPGSVGSRKKFLCHNVSNTINVPDGKWKEVAKFIYENRPFFTGISLLPATGDKDYHQAPFQEVLNWKETRIEIWSSRNICQWTNYTF